MPRPETLASHLRYASQVIPIRSQYLCPGNYRPFLGYSRQYHHTFHNWRKGLQNMVLVLFRFVLVSSCRPKDSFFFLFLFNRKIEFRYQPSIIRYHDGTSHTTQLELLGTYWYNGTTTPLLHTSNALWQSYAHDLGRARLRATLCGCH